VDGDSKWCRQRKLCSDVLSAVRSPRGSVWRGYIIPYLGQEEWGHCPEAPAMIFPKNKYYVVTVKYLL